MGLVVTVLWSLDVRLTTEREKKKNNKTNSNVMGILNKVFGGEIRSCVPRMMTDGVALFEYYTEILSQLRPCTQ